MDRNFKGIEPKKQPPLSFKWMWNFYGAQSPWHTPLRMEEADKINK